VWLSGGLAAAAEPVTVQSVVVSLIDDVHLAAQAAGVVAQVHVREGDLVTAGQLLAELDDADARLECERRQSDLQIARTEAGSQLKIQLAEKALSVAQAELARSEQSNQKFANSISETELDKLRFTRDQAQLQIEHARLEHHLANLQVQLKQTELHLAELILQRRRICSPLAGVVVRIDRQPGEWIQPGDQICRVLRTDRLRAEGFVSVQDGSVAAGRSAEATLAVGNSAPLKFSGRLTFVDPEINPITGQYRVWAELENPDGRLRPGHRPTVILPAPPAAAASVQP
jgi:RND family efflux transporter MFP subunit